jgi:hypothetical protein
MSASKLLRHENIRGKDIYIVDEHHHALAAWASVRRKLARAPNLITIDHHTDTHEAFLGHAHILLQNDQGDPWALAETFVRQIDFRDEQSVERAIHLLRHDEHINAATMADILGYAFCIQLSDGGGNQSIEQLAYAADRKTRWPQPPAVPAPRRPMTYTKPDDHIFAVSHDCAIGCNKVPHDDDCLIQHGKMIIESNYLDDQMARVAEMSRCVGITHLEDMPYILDIDLDAFHCRKAINPDDPSTFYRLIRNSTMITIATEAECVEELKFEGETIDVDMLLARLLEHIETALTT